MEHGRGAVGALGRAGHAVAMATNTHSKQTESATGAGSVGRWVVGGSNAVSRRVVVTGLGFPRMLGTPERPGSVVAGAIGGSIQSGEKP